MLNSYAYIGLGSNLGDPKAQIEQAVRRFGDYSIGIHAVSSLYRTEPVDAPSEPWFLNGVAEVFCQVEPPELMRICQEIESSQGRERKTRNGPRTIDLDLLLAGNALMDGPDLVLPHPKLHLRRFVLIPLAEIAPGLVHPRLGSTVIELLDRCPDRSAVVRLGSLAAG